MKAGVKSLLVLSIYASNLLSAQAASLEHLNLLFHTRQAEASNETSTIFINWNVSSADNSALAKAPYAGTFYREGPELANINSPFHPVTGNGGWEWAVEKARSVVGQLTLEEKVNLTAGITGGRCEGTLGRVDRFGIPELCFQDGPAGFRASDFVTVFPSGITSAATWNRDLIYKRAAALGSEFVAKGVNVHLGPVTGGPLGRSPFQGRNWEGFGPDPYLHGEAAYYTVSGTQSAGVIATAKHFLAYEQETYRQLYAASDPYTLNPNNNTELTYSSNLDDRTLHELYLWPFMNAVRAGSGGIMCVYNRINSTKGCESSKLLNTILKEELDFQGFVVTDWSAAFNTSNTYNGGSDVVMPGGMTGGYKNLVGGKDLVRALNDGEVKIDRIDDGITRLLTQWYLRGQDQGYPTVSYKDSYQNTYFNGSVVNEHRNVQGDHWKIVKEVAEEAVTLIFNKASHNTGPQGTKEYNLGLPLNKKARVAVFGSDAGPNPYGMNACQSWIGLGSQLCPANATSNGTQAVGWGSGAGFFPYLIDPLAGLSDVAKENHGAVLNNLNDVGDTQNQMLVKQDASLSDAALVFVQARSGENSDRHSLRLDAEGDELIKLVASQNNNTIVVMHTVGPVLMSAWFDHPNITALVLPHLPGQESGSSLARVLYGDVNPSGKMPYSILKDEDAVHYPKIVGSPASDPQVDFYDGIFIDYRAWDKMSLEPLIPFGHGISYTNYSYSNLNIQKSGDNCYAPSMFQAKTDKQPGGSGSLFKYLVEVTVDVKNVGGMQGDEVAQLYVGYPEEAEAPIKQLRGFDKVQGLQPNGDAKQATFKLTKRDFSIWDVVKQEFRVVDGEYKVWVGKSSRKSDLMLSGSVTMKNGMVVGLSSN
ncbi:related to beta-glucosidase [Melanopsichium pennsylvanicum]|uniref:beta-glucosidase n=2 Tax=Melanopsichium pennsylvanicum TaxID=63383 RepID=A0AAJ5C8A3_9BASI|nr:related to beta-glucosidase [Melanopsichium pennsylvanicum 4]SNX87795.1 related to beta-glucosidase [Melanopsichium pennsylvanicum]